ncbi:Uncharacterised protein [Mycobacteroides abscessus subsp. abscessus]|nr:Uncharacterised protein [Mycobacteroides abscessus subsp. abscessus]
MNGTTDSGSYPALSTRVFISRPLFCSAMGTRGVCLTRPLWPVPGGHRAQGTQKASCTSTTPWNRTQTQICTPHQNLERSSGIFDYVPSDFPSLTELNLLKGNPDCRCDRIHTTHDTKTSSAVHLATRDQRSVTVSPARTGHRERRTAHPVHRLPRPGMQELPAALEDRRVQRGVLLQR